MSILKSKHSGWTWDLKRTPFDSGGGGGGSQPTQSTSYNTNVPEYARPYVENMLQSTQAQIYNDDMTSFRPYTPYSNDPSKYFAEFTPMQQYAQSETANMQTPGQYGAASLMAGQAGMGALGANENAGMLGTEALGYGQAGQMYGGMGAQQAMNTARRTGAQAGMYGGMGSMYGQQAASLAPEAQQYGQGAANIGMGGLGYGGMGSMYGQQAANMAQQGYGAGAQFAQQATDPNAVKAYMSPYMQNVVDYQKSQAIRDYGIGQQGLKAQASRAGAFGGSRQAIQEAEAQRSLGSQLQGIEATGAQQAFNNAQQQQQFGANLGVQGLQAGYQGTGMGIQGAQTGLQGLGTAMQGQQAGLQGLQQAGSLYGQGMQGAQTGLQGVNAQQAAGNLGLAGTAQGMQGAGYGLQGVQGATSAGQYGLQGLGQATQAASTLGSLGSQQQAADLARINAQNTMGAQQQAYKQNLINQDISNYATASQYPFMQLGIMNSMLRGLPLQQTTTASYQQQPSTAQQLTGLGGAALSYMGGRREGGVIGMKEGGAVPGYKYGDLISDPQLQGMSQGLSQEQLKGRMADPQVTNNERGIFDSTMRGNEYVQSNPMAAQQMAQMSAPPQMAQAPSDEARMSGIAQAGGDMFNTMGYAGGGIIAFAGEGPSAVDEAIAKAERDAAAQDAAAKEKPKTVARDVTKNAATPATNTRENMLAQTQAMLKQQGFDPGATADEKAYADMLTKQQTGLGDATSAKERANLAKAFLKMGSNARGFLPGAIEGAESYLTGAGEIAAGKEAREMALSESKAKYAAGQRARAAGDITASDKLFHEAAQLENQLKIAQGNNAATLGAANIHAAASGKTQAFEEQAVQQYMKDHPGATYSDAYQAVKGAGRAESVEVQRIAKAIELKQNQLITATNKEEKARLKKEIDDLQVRLLSGTSPTATVAAPAPVQNKDGTITIPDQGTFKKLPNGNYEKVG
jgi:hypothetical protein